MNREQSALARKALRYLDEGTPMKDAFADGNLEQEVIIAAFRKVVRPKPKPLDCIDRLIALAQWHEEMAAHPIDVSGSDRQRAQRDLFHAHAAEDIRAALKRATTT